MSLRPGEQEALNEMKEKVNQLNQTCLWGCRDNLRMTEAELRNSGYKTQEAAVVGLVKHTLAEVEKIHKAFLKKFPD